MKLKMNDQKGNVRSLNKVINMRNLGCVVLFAMLFTGKAALAASALFDFESKEDLARWSGFDAKAFSSEYATNGKHCAILATPEWKPGMNEWPIWETTSLPVSDWSGFDRLVIDFTNPSDTAAMVRGRAADEPTSKKASYQWPAWSQTVQPRSHLRAVIPLDTFLGSAIDRHSVTRFLFYTARATPDYRVHVDNVTLLAPGEDPSALPLEYVQQIVELRLKSKSFPAARKALSLARQRVDKTDQASIRAWGDASLKALAASLDALVSESNKSQIRIDEIEAIGDAGDQITRRAGRVATLIEMRTAFASFSPVPQYTVGWATSMDKVLPRDMPLPMVQAAPLRELSVARNESEGVQVVVVPFDTQLEKVGIEVGTLTSEAGEVLPAQAVDVRVVGYIKTKRPAYDVDYVGWWPDPLLDFLSKVNIEPEDAQSFWVRVRPDKQAKPGVYEAPLRVVLENGPPTELKLRVRVRDFEVPDASPLPIATQDPEKEFFDKYKPEKWETLKLKVSDFLADYYIDYDQIYHAGAPDFDILRRLRDQGRLKAFNLCTLADAVFVPDMTDEKYEKALAKLVSEIQSGYDQAKTEGILKYAYLYGMDEVPPAAYPILKRLTDDVKKRFPDVPIMTTAQDYMYGQASAADSIDAWIPIINEYKPELAKEARQRGKKVWWYTCQSPAHPYPNIFTEYPAIEIRLLMGAMTAKYQPDGFLYYCTFRDLVYDGPPRKAADSGPFTEWDPRAFVEPFNGEGYLAYPGPNGRPLASIRLENFRDGLEDYAYWKILKERTEDSSPGDARWLSEAREALNVPGKLVKSAHEFATDWRVLYDYRETLAALIERAEAARQKK